MADQQFLEIDCDDGKKTYYTTDTGIKVNFEQCADNGGPFIRLKTPGKFELVMGYRYYKIEDRIDTEDDIDDISYFPDAEKKYIHGNVYYGVSGYKIRQYKFEMKDDSVRIPAGDIGYPLDIDILKLVEVIDDLPTKNITKKNENKIFYAIITTKLNNRSPKKAHYEGIFIDKEIFNIKLDDFSKKMGKHNEKVIDSEIMKGILRKPIDVNGKPIYITREMDGAFISIYLNKITDKTICGSKLPFNDLSNRSEYVFKYDSFKKHIPGYKNIIKLSEEYEYGSD